MLRTQHARIARLLIVALVATLALPAVAGELITVTRVTGSVKVSVGETQTPVAVGSQFSAPAKIETGANGSLRIEQASSTLEIGPNSVLLIPETAESENIVQRSGRVLYLVKPRKARSFAVQTPYLVSVVKGTVFSVAIESDAAVVSLMEGSVELVAEGIEPVLLEPNDVARRGMADRSINVTKIDATQPVAGSPAGVAGATALDNASGAAASTDTASALSADLNEITTAHRQQTSHAGGSPSTPAVPPPTPSAPEPPPVPETQAPEPPPPVAPNPESPITPTPEPVPVPVPEIPETQPEVPVPGDDDHDHDDDDDDDGHDCRRRKCDSDDDHDRGGGNDRR